MGFVRKHLRMVALYVEAYGTPLPAASWVVGALGARLALLMGADGSKSPLGTAYAFVPGRLQQLNLGKEGVELSGSWVAGGYAMSGKDPAVGGDFNAVMLPGVGAVAQTENGTTSVGVNLLPFVAFLAPELAALATSLNVGFPAGIGAGFMIGFQTDTAQKLYASARELGARAIDGAGLRPVVTWVGETGREVAGRVSDVVREGGERMREQSESLASKPPLG